MNKRLSIQELTQIMNELVESKGWYAEDSKKPQNPRNLAISLSLEAAEILEYFQWNDKILDKNELGGELADVFLYLLQLAYVSGIDLEEATLKKVTINRKRTWNDDKK